MTIGQEVLSIASPTREMRGASGKMPVGQFCYVVDRVWIPGSATVYRTNCLSHHGQSGGIQFLKYRVYHAGKLYSEWAAKSMNITGEPEDAGTLGIEYKFRRSLQGEHLQSR